MPQTFRETLRENNQAMEKWRLQPMSRRKEILQYLNSLKNEESIRRNTSKIVSSLLKPKKARPKASV